MEMESHRQKKNFINSLALTLNVKCASISCNNINDVCKFHDILGAYDQNVIRLKEGLTSTHSTKLLIDPLPSKLILSN